MQDYFLKFQASISRRFCWFWVEVGGGCVRINGAILKTVANQAKMNPTFIGMLAITDTSLCLCVACTAYLVSFVNLFKSVVIPC